MCLSSKFRLQIINFLHAVTKFLVVYIQCVTLLPMIYIVKNINRRYNSLSVADLVDTVYLIWYYSIYNFIYTFWDFR